MPLSKWAIRLGLGTEELPAKAAIGYDCNGNLIKAGDRVEVVEEELFREDNSEFEFCSKGKQGIAVCKPGENYKSCNFAIEIEFDGENGEKKRIYTWDYFLQLVL
ncbi:MAG: hypothetical protein AAB477_02720 [Patescibacteria group bacterium]